MIQGKETSPITARYNCIAWATKDDLNFWWPKGYPPYFWPDGAPLEETLDAFIKAYELQGFQVCRDAALEQGFEKIAIYVDEYGSPKHAARQLDEFTWTSKLGSNIDISHSFVDKWDQMNIDGQIYDLSIYGKLGQLMKRASS